jgi:hypothetical protein
LDHVASWETLVEPINTTFEGHGGPNAPHIFKFFSRSELQFELQHACPLGTEQPVIKDFEPHVATHPRDVFLMTKPYMSSRPLQFEACCPFLSRIGHLRHQPVGDRPLKPFAQGVETLLKAQCTMALSQKLITTDAHDFLTSWALGNLPRIPRPLAYKYLDHRWQEPEPQLQARVPIAYDGVGAPNHVRVVIREVVGGPVGAVYDEEADGADDGPLIIADV